MGVIGDFSIPAESFALDDALAAAPGVTVVADRMASHSTMEVLPFLWTDGSDLDRFHASLEDDGSVESLTVAEETDDERLYRIQWDEEFCALINEIVDHHAAIVDARASERVWDLTLRFAKEEHVGEFQDHFRSEGRGFDVHHLASPDEPRGREFGVTDEQYEALVLAADEGYFEVPRRTSVEDLGDRFDISANSFSQRLRRGTGALVENALKTHGRDSN